MRAQSLRHALLFAAPWAVACQATLFFPRVSPGKNTGVGCHFLLQSLTFGGGGGGGNASGAKVFRTRREVQDEAEEVGRASEWTYKPFVKLSGAPQMLFKFYGKHSAICRTQGELLSHSVLRFNFRCLYSSIQEVLRTWCDKEQVLRENQCGAGNEGDCVQHDSKV